MRKAKFFCAAALSLMAGLFLHAQQSTHDWYPNIGEDNKAATWEDTFGFMKSALENKALVPMAVTTPGNCYISMAFGGEEHKDGFFVTIYTYDLKSIDPLTVHVLPKASSDAWDVSVAGRAYASFGTSAIVHRSNVSNPGQQDYTACKPNEDNCEQNQEKLSEPDSTAMKDQESARRLARAFFHAALLCGGKRAVSPF
jgi:hypothetical protein